MRHVASILLPRELISPGPRLIMNVFDLRDQLSADYARFFQGFLRISDARIAEMVQQSFG